jgi:hypothetical protein
MKLSMWGIVSSPSTCGQLCRPNPAEHVIKTDGRDNPAISIVD